MNALCPELDAFILRVAPLHVAGPNDTLANLFPWACTHVLGRDPLPVWDGASDRTPYGSPAVNHAARAWHDATHIQLGLGFTFAEEIRVVAEQIRIARVSGLGPMALAIIEADGAGQQRYLQRFGHFPADQRAFVLAELAPYPSCTTP